MRIVHFAKFYPPEFGGIESVTEALAEDHALSGHDVEVICFSRGASQVEREGSLAIRRVKVQVEKASQPVAFKYLAHCLKAARGADIVHVHTPNLLAALAVCLMRARACIIVHWHADIEGKGFLGRLVRPLERAMLRRADRIIATTAAYANSSPSLAGFRDKVEVIPIGISDVEYLPPQMTGNPYVLFVGRLVPYKGVPVLLEAMTLIDSSVDLRIVGVGPQESALRAQVRTLGIHHRVHFMGRVDMTRLQQLFAGAKVFCLPSLNRLEAFGVVLLEAMRAGRAILTSDIPGSGVPWVNASGVSVPVGDAEALAGALNRLISDPDAAVRMGAAARARFENEFSRTLMSKRFEKVYEKVVEKGGCLK